MDKQQQLKYVAEHRDLTADQIATKLRIGKRTVERLRASLAPKETPITGDAVTNLRQQQQQLRESLAALPIGSEGYRKTVGSIAALEVQIAKLAPAVTNETEYEFVAYLDGAGQANTRPLDRCPADVQQHIQRQKDIRNGSPLTDVEIGLDNLATKAGELHSATVTQECPDNVSKMAHDVWTSALRLTGFEVPNRKESNENEV